MAQLNIVNTRKQIVESRRAIKALGKQAERLRKALLDIECKASVIEMSMDDIIGKVVREQKGVSTLAEYRRLEVLHDQAAEVCTDAEVLGAMLQDAARNLD